MHSVLVLFHFAVCDETLPPDLLTAVGHRILVKCLGLVLFESVRCYYVRCNAGIIAKQLRMVVRYLYLSLDFYHGLARTWDLSICHHVLIPSAVPGYYYSQRINLAFLYKY